MDKRTCSINDEDCSKGGPLKRGWCNAHYRRWYKNGDPLITFRIYGDDERRFWSKVDKNGPIPEHRPDLGACWVWTGGLNQGIRQGYGHFPLGQKLVFAHRFAYELMVGPIPDDLPHIDHLCRNHACVRPSHLEPVTQRENALRGDRTKLSDELVADLYVRRLAGESIASLAAETGAGYTCLYKRFRRIAQS